LLTSTSPTSHHLASTNLPNSNPETARSTHAFWWHLVIT